MICGKEKLFEAITGPRWEIVESTGELFLYNRERNRRFSYFVQEEWYGGVIATLGVSFRNGYGEWTGVLSMNHLLTDEGEERVSFLILTRADGTNPLDEMVFYDTKRRWEMGGGSLPEHPLSERVAKDRKELLYEREQLPEKLDYELTANLFVKQMIDGEVERPVLVPEGLFRYVEPVELAPGTMATYANLTVAGRLMADAKTPEESRVATSIFSLVLDRDIMRFPK
ncbi:hypothetical protein A3D09_00665 [Candidatus Collierbacteria bacterium RIFCSPHIGHO2_02_FULL_49_10]|uniref:Uncharacterized protein n=2 Tax=Candidatus Collieribacteriota TaxID=1752725 RepID=A0A1F5ETT2_9BACT|nr:MAG: hypothetical protein A3D09_00665 [Candidatus Collierbacteria bacterium RIFCSPHIGHO2_02_FULL_49_10]OGD72113.1 MAG: hypothetical protein A2703_03700 [Candidatus Collierbacteria bacterium RIFCSPHIGHO2_01_FULL_50_25]